MQINLTELHKLLYFTEELLYTNGTGRILQNDKHYLNFVMAVCERFVNCEMINNYVLASEVAQKSLLARLS